MEQSSVPTSTRGKSSNNSIQNVSSLPTPVHPLDNSKHEVGRLLSNSLAHAMDANSIRCSLRALLNCTGEGSRICMDRN